MIEQLPIVIILITAGVLYAVAVRRVWARTSHRVLPPARVACFGLGLLVVAAALMGPLDGMADSRFSAHMLQHVLLILVAAPLFALATPVTALVVSLPASVRRQTTTPLLRSRAARVVLSPTFALCSFVIVLWGSHVPALYDAAVENQALHDLEHLLYLVTAVLFWSAVAGLDIGPPRLPHSARLLYLFISMAAMEVIGLVLSVTKHPLYPAYVHAGPGAELAATRDMHTGGVLMWVSGTIAIPAMVAVLISWLADDERRTAIDQARLDAQLVAD